MTQPEHGTVAIGVSGARIVDVSQERIDYIDEAGQTHSIDLAECARNWCQWRDSHRHEFRLLPGWDEQSSADWNVRCVGERGGSWAEFMNEPKTRFEFANHETLYQELLTPLRLAGWHSFDTT